MAPVATHSSRRSAPYPVVKRFFNVAKSRLFNRSTRSAPHRMVGGLGNTISLSNGWKILDASGGAAVSCIGRVDERVERAVVKQMRLGLSYVSSMAFDTDVAEKLASYLTTSTNDEMTKVVFYSSGSETVEAACKLTIQYHAKEKMYPEPTRTQFIARDRSYHGATLGALALSGHKARKEVYQSVLPRHVSRIAPCYPYRDQGARETDAEYLFRLKDGLRQKILELGPNNVAGFIVEPVVGAALGCVPAVPGYLKAMREVCDDYGVLLITDEVMCGMGRTGYLHAWQKENVVPDIQLVGKGLAGGFQPLSAMLIRKNIADAFQNGPGSGAFIHGHTFQNFTLACAAGLEVQKIIEKENLIQNVRVQGRALSGKLRERLGNHPNVGDIRGEGLFWGIEFVCDKETKEPFHPDAMVAWNMFQMGLAPPYEIHVYPGSGTVDGQRGDHIIISPSYNTTDVEVNMIVDRVGRLVEDFFNASTPSVPEAVLGLKNSV